MSIIIDEVKKEIEAKELEAKKEKIWQMLNLISQKEKQAESKAQEAAKIAEEIAELKTQLEKEDYSAVECINSSLIGSLSGSVIYWKI